MKNICKYSSLILFGLSILPVNSSICFSSAMTDENDERAAAFSLVNDVDNEDRSEDEAYENPYESNLRQKLPRKVNKEKRKGELSKKLRKLRFLNNKIQSLHKGAKAVRSGDFIEKDEVHPSKRQKVAGLCIEIAGTRAAISAYNSSELEKAGEDPSAYNDEFTANYYISAARLLPNHPHNTTYLKKAIKYLNRDIAASEEEEETEMRVEAIESAVGELEAMKRTQSLIS